MTNFLAEIIETKKKRLEKTAGKRPLDAWRREAFNTRRHAPPHRLRVALQRDRRINIIAEFKRASPSKGTIRESVVPSELARAYEMGGAAAISVLTEEDYFQGSLDDLSAVRAAVSLPVLRKDFIFDEIQLYEAAIAGADALLLIVAALDDYMLAHLRRITENDLGMDALVEVHTADEMRRARASGATIIGVNNRDLRTFDVSLDVSINLASGAPPSVLLVSESGLQTGADIRRLQACGYRGFLIGETLMRADQPAEALRALLN